MDTKIVFFDIDGTIYSYEKGIPKDTAKAIELLKANGHIPVICTGRTKCMIYPDFINLGFDNIRVNHAFCSSCANNRKNKMHDLPWFYKLRIW